MNESQLLKKLALAQQAPELSGRLSDQDLSKILLTVIEYVRSIQGLINDGRVKGDKGDKGEPGDDGYTPKPGKDYLPLSIAQKQLDTALADIRKEVRSRMDAIRDGEDAVITDEQIDEAAKRAFAMIELPDFQALITAEPTAIRDALELLQGDERLEMSAVKDLEQTLNDIRASIQRSMLGGGGTSQNKVQEMITASLASSGGVTFETPSGDVDSTNVTYNVTQTPKYIISDGATYFENAGYTLAGLTITMTVPPQSFIRSAY